MKRFALFLLATALGAPLHLLAQAPAAGFQRLPSGTEYKLFRRDAGGRYQPRPLSVSTDSAYSTRQGRFLMAHMSFLTGRDSVLQSTRKQLHNHPVPLPLQPVTKKGGQEEAISLVLPGDSAIFRFTADSLFKGRPVPPELKRSGNVLVAQIVGVQVVTETTARAAMQQVQEQMMAEQMQQAKAHAAAQLPKDNAAIQEYMKQNNLTATAKKTPGGTWYAITKRGTGALPQAGQTVSVKYRGTVLASGQEFDSSAKHGDKPFEFSLGQGQVIQGWDQGIAMLPKGSTAILLIPSSLAYGPRGAGADIPADASLRFDVELVDIKGTAATAAPSPQKRPTGSKPGTKKAPVSNKSKVSSKASSKK